MTSGTRRGASDARTQAPTVLVFECGVMTGPIFDRKKMHVYRLANDDAPFSYGSGPDAAIEYEYEYRDAEYEGKGTLTGTNG